MKRKIERKQPVDAQWREQFVRAARSELQWHGYAEFMLYMFLTGRRLDEAIRIETRHVIWPGPGERHGVATIYGTKTRRTEEVELVIPAILVPDLRGLVATRERMIASGEARGSVKTRFTNGRLFSIKNKDRAHENWKAICEKAGIPHRTPHAMRHTFATDLTQKYGVTREALTEGGLWAKGSRAVDRYLHSTQSAGELSDIVGGDLSPQNEKNSPHWRSKKKDKMSQGAKISS